MCSRENSNRESERRREEDHKEYTVGGNEQTKECEGRRRVIGRREWRGEDIRESW